MSLDEFVDDCVAAGGSFQLWVFLHDMIMLGRNLAVAGALCASFELGIDYVVGVYHDAWHPNARGRGAPHPNSWEHPL